MSEHSGRGPDEPRWGPATTYRAKPSMRRRGATGAGASGSSSGSSSGSDDGGYDEPPRSAARREPREPRPPRQRRRGRSTRRVLVAVVVVLLIVAIGYPYLLARSAMNALNRVDAMSGATLDDTPGRTYLVVGSDSREGSDLTGELDTARTDTILLLHRPKEGPTVMLSIPRDSYVDVPGQGENKINAAYAIGGPPLLVNTVEQATGVQIDDYVETNLAGFGQVANAIGGVRVCPKTDLKDDLVDLDLKSGCQEVDGDTALSYARTRKTDPRGDLGRVERQREVLAAIAGKGMAPSTVLNPSKAFPLTETGGKALTVDNDTGMVSLGFFLLTMKDSAGGEGLSLTVPVGDTTRRTDHGVVVDWDTEPAEIVFAALRDSNTEPIRAIAEAQEAEAGG